MSSFWHFLTQLDAADIKGLAANNMGVALVVCFFSGILTSLTPCVYPMIPITINIFGRAAQRETRTAFWGFNPYSFRMACIYVIGMCTTYSLLGVVAGMTGSLFGSFLQNAWMLIFLSLLFLILSLSQLGLFKIQLPVAIQSRLAGTGSAKSGVGIFLMGLISGVIVSPCVGPVIGGILAFVFDTSNAMTGLLYFLSFSLGLGVLFLLIGAFSGLVNRIPRAGVWMLRVNRILAILLLAASGYYGLLWLKRVGFIQQESPQSALTWGASEAEARAQARASGKILVVDFTASWCEACHVIDQTVFHNPKVIEKLKDLVLVRIDLTQSTPANEELSRRYQVLGLPSVVFLRPNGSLASQRVTGVLTPSEFLALLDEASTRQQP